MELVFIHLFNNFSGSPNVLAVLVKGLLKGEYDITLLTNRSEGFLSKIEGVKYHYLCYKWIEKNHLLTFFFFVIAQIQLFFLLLFKKSKNRIYYINTILPIGAILACWLTRKNYYIHVHENMQQKKSLYPLYKFVYKYCNKKSIFVSKYVQEQAVNVKDSIIAYNGLSNEFMNKIEIVPLLQRSSILMLCSLRSYKGIFEFINLADRLPGCQFEMVVSDAVDNVNAFCKRYVIPHNLHIYPSQTDVHSFYQKARLVVNLSDSTACIETFGLTLLEAFSYGIPAIGPMVGGPTEIIDDGKNGFLVDSKNTEELLDKVRLLMEDEKLYLKMSDTALQKAKTFSSENMVDAIESYLHLK